MLPLLFKMAQTLNYRSFEINNHVTKFASSPSQRDSHSRCPQSVLACQGPTPTTIFPVTVSSILEFTLALPLEWHVRKACSVLWGGHMLPLSEYFA